MSGPGSVSQEGRVEAVATATVTASAAQADRKEGDAKAEALGKEVNSAAAGTFTGMSKETGETGDIKDRKICELNDMVRSHDPHKRHLDEASKFCGGSKLLMVCCAIFPLLLIAEALAQDCLRKCVTEEEANKCKDAMMQPEYLLFVHELSKKVEKDKNALQDTDLKNIVISPSILEIWEKKKKLAKEEASDFDDLLSGSKSKKDFDEIHGALVLFDKLENELGKLGIVPKSVLKSDAEES